MEWIYSLANFVGNIFSPEAVAGYVETFGVFIYILIFIVAFLESFIFTGLVMPGTVMVVFMGFLAAQGPLNIFALFAVTAAAAILGDIFNYVLGLTQGGRLVVIISEKLKLKTDYLKIGEDFFLAHGDKSVFIGRFTALIRPFIPFVAGIFKMRWRIFLFWNILSGILWAGLYLALGYFFGAALQTVVEWSGRAAVVLLIILSFAIATYLVRKKTVGR